MTVITNANKLAAGDSEEIRIARINALVDAIIGLGGDRTGNGNTYDAWFVHGI